MTLNPRPFYSWVTWGCPTCNRWGRWLPMRPAEAAVKLARTRGRAHHARTHGTPRRAALIYARRAK